MWCKCRVDCDRYIQFLTFCIEHIVAGIAVRNSGVVKGVDPGTLAAVFYCPLEFGGRKLAPI